MYSFVIIDTFAAKERESEHSNNTNFEIRGARRARQELLRSKREKRERNILNCGSGRER